MGVPVETGVFLGPAKSTKQHIVDRSVGATDKTCAAHIKKVQSRAIYVHENMARNWLGHRRIGCELDFGRVVELLDYKCAHGGGG
jgi:hypothetical protein